MPDHPTFRDLVPDAEDVAAGIESICDQLEAAGWNLHSRWGAHSIRFWPEHGRPKQITIDLRYPINEHRARSISEQTGVALTTEVKEE